MKLLCLLLLACLLTSPALAGICPPTADGCADCDADSKCLKCKAAYYFVPADGTTNAYCRLCPANTGKGPDLSTQTTEGVCNVDCSPGCKYCGTDPSICLGCYEGFRKSSGACVACAAGKGRASDSAASMDDTTCSDCTASSNCATCRHPDVCTRCKRGYSYIPSDGTCLRCPSGRTKDPDVEEVNDGTVYNCDLFCSSDCFECYFTDSCSRCRAGYQIALKGSSLPRKAGCELCNPGTGKDADDSDFDGQTIFCGTKCDPSCDLCTETSNYCLKCAAGYFMSAEGLCTLCPSGFGKKADQDFTVPTTGELACTITCSANCRNCYGEGAFECLNCKEHYYFYGDGSCSMCSGGKTKFEDTLIVIQAQTDAGACTIDCDDSCLYSCRGPGTGKCDSCFKSHYWAGNNLCLPCADRTGKGYSTDIDEPLSRSETCDATCSPKCKNCDESGDQTCTSCYEGYYRESATSGNCIICPSGKGKAKDLNVLEVKMVGESACTLTCHKSCNNCNGVTATSCLNCAAHHYLSAAGTCTLCPPHTLKNTETTITGTLLGPESCQAGCHPDCKWCSEANSNTACLACHAGYFLRESSCVPCPAGKGSLAHSTLQTRDSIMDEHCEIKCHHSCLTCSGLGATECVYCAAGYYLSAAGTCTVCSVKGKDADTELPTISTDNGVSQCTTTCALNCNTCFGSNFDKCLTCAADHFYASAGVCVRCDPGYYKPVETGTALHPLGVYQTWDQDCLLCHESCQYCTGPAANQCTRCAAGFYYSAAGVCSQCPAGFGKLKDDSPPAIVSDPTTVCQDACDTGCLLCNGNGVCLKCKAGYYFAGAPGCQLCPLGKGKSFDTAIMSSAQDAETVCSVTCEIGCAQCTGEGPGKCLACYAGYYKSATGTCTQCPAGWGSGMGTVFSLTELSTCDTECFALALCNTCSDYNDQCTSCSAGTFMSEAGLCIPCENHHGKPADASHKFPLTLNVVTQAAACTIPCDSKCAYCGGSSTYCMACADEYFYAGEGVCTSCGPGKGKSADAFYRFFEPVTADMVCEDCDPSCKTCSGAGTFACLSCSAGRFLSPVASCEPCAPGKGKAADSGPATRTNGQQVCNLNCHSSCINCQTETSTGCLNCFAGFYYSGNGECSQCPENTGKSRDLMEALVQSATDACSPCHISSALCKGPNEDDSLLCGVGFFQSNPVVCQKCPLGTGKPKDLTHQRPGSPTHFCTVKCDRSCHTCSAEGPGNCLGCNSGYFWEGNGVCTSCPARRGKPADPELTLTPASSDACTEDCHPSCLTCEDGSPFGCIKCAAGYFLAAPGICEQCAPGTGKPADANLPELSLDDGLTECSLRCHPSCTTCKDNTATGCLGCAASYFMESLGTCSRCGLGYGSIADPAPVPEAEIFLTVCLTCDASCGYCKGASANDCLSCSRFHYWAAQNTCQACPIRTGKLPDSGNMYLPVTAAETCTACHESCIYCQGPLATDCIICAAGYFQDTSNNNLCTPCAPRSGKAADVPFYDNAVDAAACIDECPSDCKVCDGSTCLSCAQGYYKSNSDECSLCPDGFTKLEDTSPVFSPTVEGVDVCTIPCAFPCAACIGANYCIKCQGGYFMSDDGVCSVCRSTYGKFADDSYGPTPSTDEGVTECEISCGPMCSSCSGILPEECVGCSQGFYWTRNGCMICPPGTSKIADTSGFAEDQTPSACNLKCHQSCQTCSGPGESQCLSCNAGYKWAGNGKCDLCPTGRGKLPDIDYFPTDPATDEVCNIYCDSCFSGCQTCAGDPQTCMTCAPGRFLSDKKTCEFCSDACVDCTELDTCKACAKNYKLSADGKKCIGDCTVDNCAECPEDKGKCTKCNDEYVLKSDTQCILDVAVAPAMNISSITSTSSIVKTEPTSDQISVVFDPATQSRDISAVVVQDKLTGEQKDCEALRCKYYFTPEDRLQLEFNPDTPIPLARVTIQRRPSKKSSRMLMLQPQCKQKKRVLQQELSAYPVVIDDVTLMGASGLTTFGFALRVIVGILRLPLSLLVYWRFPHLAMLMDHMVTQLKVYGLISGPYIAYVEVAFQSVSTSGILPFNFDNPFYKWNSATTNCVGFPGLRSKGMDCSWFDNYGPNFIGFASVIVLSLILYYTGAALYKESAADSFMNDVFRIWKKDYGLKFVMAKIDANHLEIILVTLIAYSTADNSSKSVIGMILGSILLLLIATIGFLLVFATKTRLQPRGNSISTTTSHQGTATKLYDVVGFAFEGFSTPVAASSIYFHLIRYTRAVLLVVFVTCIRDAIGQTVSILILESIYFACLLMLDNRGDKVDKYFYAGVHVLMLLHLLFRTITTSPSISLNAVHSGLGTTITVIVVIYIWVHIICALALLFGMFKQTTSPKKMTQIEQDSASKPNERLESEHNLIDQKGAPQLEAAQVSMPELPEERKPFSAHGGRKSANPSARNSIHRPQDPPEPSFHMDIPKEDHSRNPTFHQGLPNVS